VIENYQISAFTLQEAGEQMINKIEEKIKAKPKYNQRETFMHKVHRKKLVVYCCFQFCILVIGCLLAVAFGSG
jgi:hypothetical protein